jgi:hypothetical protein
MRRRLEKIAVCGAFALVLAAGVAAVFLAPDPPPGFLIGIARPPLDVAALRKVRESGANSFRRTLEWSAVRKPGGNMEIPPVFVSALVEGRRLGLMPIVVLGYGHREFDGGGYPQSDAALRAFGEFARFAVGKLGGLVTQWELWNEWNRGTGMPAWAGRGLPDAYVRFLERIAPEVRGADPRAQVWGGAMEGIGRFNRWTENACRAGMLRPLDALTFHPYEYFLPPEERVPERGLLGFVRELEATISSDSRGGRIPLYVTELGWPTHEGGVTLEEQAKFIARALLLLRANPRVRGVWIYTLYDREGSATNLENHFGLLFPDGSPKPAWHAFRGVATLLRGAKLCEALDFGAARDSLAGVSLEDSFGRKKLAVWAIEPGEKWKIVLRWPGRTGFRPEVGLKSVSASLGVTTQGAWEQCEFTVMDMPAVIGPVPAGAIVETAAKQGER